MPFASTKSSCPAVRRAEKAVGRLDEASLQCQALISGELNFATGLTMYVIDVNSDMDKCRMERMEECIVNFL